jgi:hypothetical protein
MPLPPSAFSPWHYEQESAQQNHWSQCGRRPVSGSKSGALGRPHRSVPVLTIMKPVASAGEQSKLKLITRQALLCLGALILVAALLVGGFRAYWWRYKHARAVWKTAALQRLSGLTATNEDIRRELGELKASPREGDYQRWTGDQVVLMTNGEYIVYRFWHGANSGFVDHLFLGHCSVSVTPGTCDRLEVSAVGGSWS